jgi:hypothetical protein
VKPVFGIDTRGESGRGDARDARQFHLALLVLIKKCLIRQKEFSKDTR